ncbi:MAG: GNAT family N-acetyltransferase [Dehalococcoidia bacterium]|nr:GNAT family N-acetyltransferase [Dehalococcoidia bacterium]
MPGIHIRDFRAVDLPDAAALLAARQVRDREQLPFLAKAYEEPRECEPLLRQAISEPAYGGGVAALSGDTLVGYLLAEKNLFPPTSLPAQFIPPYTMSVGLQCHAVSSAVDAVEVYRAMYAAAAERWVASGFFEHRVYVIAGDRDAEEAWVTCGFGRGLTCAVRPTADPVSVAGELPGLEIHQAASEDLDVVMRLEHTNNAHHWGSPIFWPYLHETQPAAREHQANLLAEAANAHFVAYRDGVPVGMDTFNAPDWVNPMLQGGRMIYLFQGVVEEAARGGGVGKALLARSMAWAHEQGYDWCALHFASMNPSGAPFWRGQGFVPVEHTMARRIDERVAWARP